MPEILRSASRPAAGAARGTIATAIGIAVAALVTSQGQSPEVAAAAGSLAGGIVAYIGKLLRGAFPNLPTPI